MGVTPNIPITIKAIEESLDSDIPYMCRENLKFLLAARKKLWSALDNCTDMMITVQSEHPAVTFEIERELAVLDEYR